MNNIPQSNQKENDFTKSIINFVKQFKVINTFKKANCYKEKGICVHDIFCYLLQLVYTGKSMYMNYQTENNEPKFGKDVVYRFLNSMYINWQSFLLKLSETIINGHIVNLTSEERINAIVVDNLFYGRLRSENVELLAIENRNNQDACTIGELFFLAYDELQDIQFSEALKVILDILQETLQELLFLTDEQIDVFINTFITKLPKYLSEKLTSKKVA